MALRVAIEEVVLEFPGYGYRRVTKALRRLDWRVNHKRVLRIMRDEALLCQLRRRWVPTTDSGHGWAAPGESGNGDTGGSVSIHVTLPIAGVPSMGLCPELPACPNKRQSAQKIGNQRVAISTTRKPDRAASWPLIRMTTTYRPARSRGTPTRLSTMGMRCSSPGGMFTGRPTMMFPRMGPGGIDRTD